MEKMRLVNCVLPWFNFSLFLSLSLPLSLSLSLFHHHNTFRDLSAFPLPKVLRERRAEKTRDVLRRVRRNRVVSGLLSFEEEKEDRDRD